MLTKSDAEDDTVTLLDRLVFPECPRWRDDRLYFSDIYAGEIHSLDVNGRDEVIARMPQRGAGLGWSAEGDLLIVGMLEQKLYRLPPVFWSPMPACPPFQSVPATT